MPQFAQTWSVAVFMKAVCNTIHLMFPDAFKKLSNPTSDWSVQTYLYMVPDPFLLLFYFSMHALYQASTTFTCGGLRGKTLLRYCWRQQYSISGVTGPFYSTLGLLSISFQDMQCERHCCYPFKRAHFTWKTFECNIFSLIKYYYSIVLWSHTSCQ